MAALRELTDGSIAPYSAVYLGFPYCRLYPGNLMTNGEDLARAIDLLHREGKKAYLSTPAAPSTADLDWITGSVRRAAAEGVDGVCAHNLGVTRLVSREYPGLRLHTGPFANVYTNLTARLLSGYGVKRVAPHFELSLAEMRLIGIDSGLEIEVLVHGKMALAITDHCHPVTDLGRSCPEACSEDLWLVTGDLALKPAGLAMFSGRDVCLAEHLDQLVNPSFVFRVETLTETPDYRRTVGEIYRRALGGAGCGAAELAGLARLSPRGLCNGYYFGISGRTYVNGKGEIA